MMRRKRTGKVLVNFAVSGRALEVLALNEALNAFLDDHWVGAEARRELLGDLSDELGVLHALARLHHAHDRGLNPSSLS